MMPELAAAITSELECFALRGRWGWEACEWRDCPRDPENGEMFEEKNCTCLRRGGNTQWTPR